MKITQISVFIDNKKGRLYDVCSLLGKNGVNVRALTIAESPEFGILRIVVDDPEKAVRILKENSFVANLTEIVAVEVEDKPGGLAAMLKIFVDSDINVEYMYGFVEKHADRALMVFRFDDPDKAITLLQKNSFKVLGKKDMGNL